MYKVSAQIRTKWFCFVATAVVLVLVRIPFYWTHHIQEDAYITFRTAFHLADNGVFSFNLDSHIPGTTSVLYPIFIAGLKVVFGKFTLYALQLFATIALFAGSYFASSAITKTVKQRYWLWTLSSISPVGLYASYICMEAPFVILLIGLVLYYLRNRNRILGLSLCFFLAPLIRPDSIAISLMAAICLLFLERQRIWWPLVATVFGVLISMSFNYLTSGSWIIATARAKEISYHPSYSPLALLQRIIYVLFVHSFATPIDSKYLYPLSPVFGALSIVICAYVILRFRFDRETLTILIFAVSLVICLPITFALGGVVFLWYLIPSNWLLEFLLIFALLDMAPELKKTCRIAMVYGSVIIIFLFSSLQYFTSLNTGTQEYHYRGDVGRFLGERSHHMGTLFLEPAGLIPFYSDLKTTDEIGLVSDDILIYRLRYRNDWWIRYVENEKPTFIVQRDSFRHFTTYEGYTLTPSEIAWFENHYVKIGDFHYNPAAYYNNYLMLKLLSHGSHADYPVFQLYTQ
jgi:hypothetical protein